MRIDILTLFPDICNAFLNESIIGRARGKGIIDVHCHQIREYAYDKHKRVDDEPYGGMAGMLMLAEPIALCFEDICKKTDSRPRLIYMSAQGSVLTQKKVKSLSEYEHIAVLCGHYEGVDERVIEEYVDEQISIGDYVLTGGELPALVLVDAVSRMIPGVLSSNESFEEESHYNGLLEYPQYTRPSNWRGREVPKVLISGHHANIKKWNHDQSIIKTSKHRPDLLKRSEMSEEDINLLKRTNIFSDKD